MFLMAMAGYPLQTKLAEYYAMVEFVRVGVLGPYKLFKTRVCWWYFNSMFAEMLHSDFFFFASISMPHHSLNSRLLRRSVSIHRRVIWLSDDVESICCKDVLTT